jgi:hypothetical protein
MRIGKVAIAVDRVRRQVKAERLFLLAHPLSERPVRAAWQLDRRAAGLLRAKQAALPADPCGFGLSRDRYDRFCRLENGCTLGLDRVKRTGAGKAFDLPPVEQPCADTVSEIVD